MILSHVEMKILVFLHDVALGFSNFLLLILIIRIYLSFKKMKCY
jgi:hypothetical protein